MAIRNVVFDMGMVLLNWNPLQACLRHCGGDLPLAEKICGAVYDHPEWNSIVDFGTMTDREYLTIAQNRLDTPEEKALAAEIMEDYYLDALFPNMDSEPLVDDLLAAGYRVFLLSNAGARLREYLYKIRRIKDFSGVLISAEERLMKPDPRIYRLAEERFGLLPEETLFVDDRPVNVEGARACGWLGFCFDTADVPALRRLLGV